MPDIDIMFKYDGYGESLYMNDLNLLLMIKPEREVDEEQKCDGSEEPGELRDVRERDRLHRVTQRADGDPHHGQRHGGCAEEGNQIDPRD